MQLVEKNNCWYVISDIGRRYDLCKLTDFCGGSYDIIVIMDFNYQRQVDYFYEAGRFDENDKDSLMYIKSKITTYEKHHGYLPQKYNVLKEF